MLGIAKLFNALKSAFFTPAIPAPATPKGNTMFETIKTKAQAEIDQLKVDARSVEERIEAAFKLGALHHALADAEAKIRAEFDTDTKS